MSNFYSFPKASRDGSLPLRDKDMNIGPGVYDSKIEVVKKSNPLWSFNREQRNQTKANDTPGPGGYDSIGKVTKRAPMYSIGGKNTVEIKENGPGPGAYEPKPVNLKNYPKFTFSGKINGDFATTKNAPAPSVYEPKIDFMKPSSAKVIFPKAKRGESCSKPYNIGPGDYELKDVKDTKGGYMSILRKGVVDDYNRAPAPGMYDIHETTFNLNKNAAPCMKSKNQPVKFENHIPGPGQYNANPSVVKKRPASCKFGTSTRGQSLNSEAPGAGTYEPKDTFIKRTGQSWKFGTAEAFNNVPRTDSPGPGAYEINPAIGDSKPKFSFGVKTNNSKLNDTPAPGNYEPKFDFISDKGNQSMGTSFGKNSRFYSTKDETTLGPGLYEPNIPKSRCNIVFGKDRRDKFDKLKGDMPGPGNYEISGAIEEGLKKKRGVSIKMRGQSANLPKEMPGPGSYDLNVDLIKKRDQSVKIGKNPRFRTELEEGCKSSPGQYEPKILERKSNLVFGKDLRFKEVRNDSPAPGQYDPQPPAKSIKFTMRPKTSISKFNDAPGPGQYSANIALAKPKMPNLKFGTALRSAHLNDKNNIGPGQYDTVGKTTGPSYSFGKDKKCKLENTDLPGPGNYTIKSAFSDIPSYIKSTLKNRLDL